MSRTDPKFRNAPGPVPALFAAAVAVIALLAGTAPAAPAAPENVAPAAAAPAPAPSAEGKDLLERYTAEALSESVLLRPRAESSAVRSIEIDSDGNVLVNGKEFDEEELTGFLGEDGRRLAALSRLGFDDMRAALGLAVEAEEEAEAGAVPPSAPGAPGLPKPPRPPRPPHVGGAGHDDRVSVGNSIHVAEGETTGDVVCVGCSVTIDGEAFGDAVAIGGSLEVGGMVHGEAVSVGGSIDVTESGQIQGEATSVGGTINVEEGGQVLGKRNSIGIGGPMIGNWGHGFKFPFGVFGDAGRLLAAIFRTGVLAILGVLAFLLLRPAVQRSTERSREEPWKALFAGLLVQLLFLPVLVLVTVVLAVSIVGIPLLALVPVALLAFAIAALVGFTGVARAVGGWVERRTRGKFSSEVLTVIVGLLLIQAFSLVGRAVSLPGGWFAFVGFSLVCLGFFLKYLAWTVGLGAMTLVAFSRDWRRPKRVSAEAPAEAAAEPAAVPAEVEEKTEPGALPPPPPPAD